MVFQKDYTMCLSSQVGCSLRCVFCESGQSGFIRNLTNREIYDQFITIEKDLNSNVFPKGAQYLVFMGVGEPLLNYDNIKRAIKSISNYKKIRIAICTSGITNKINNLIEDNLNIKLCIFLNATNQERRKTIMPIANRFKFKNLIKAIYNFEKSKKTFDTIDIHYLIFDRFNDRELDAKKLVKLFKNGDFKIIIKYPCPIKNQKLFKAKNSKIKKFMSILDKSGIKYSCSKSRGRDIRAGCGQLRRQLMKEVKRYPNILKN